MLADVKTKTVVRLVLAALALPLMATSAQAAQDLTLRVEEVLVPFSVMDGDRFVPGLGASDFIVLEDGKTQVIEDFTSDPVPLSAVLMIDSGLTSVSFRALAESREALIKAFNLTEQHRALGFADEVAVYRYDNRVTLLQDFTEDEDAVRKSLDWMEDYEGGVGRVGGQAPIESPVINGVPVSPTAARPQTADRRVLHDAVDEAALALRSRDADRRKVIIMISDGTERESLTSYEDVQFRLLETEVQIFAISIRTGLINRLFGNLASPLDDYADFTGGDVYVTGPGDLDPLYARLTSQARAQYVLTYRSTNEAPRDRLVFREIEIRSRDGYSVFHRAGYYQAPR
jgi:VWFA-related protein